MSDFGDGQFENGKLQDKEEDHDKDEGFAHIPHGVQQVGAEAFFQDGVHGIVGNGVVQASVGEQGEGEHGHDGTQRTKGDEAETVLGGVAAAHREGYADAERHDEGHRDGPGGDTARIEGHGQERALAPVDEDGGQAEQQHVPEHEDAGKVQVEENLHDTQKEHDANADANGVDEYGAVHDGRYLRGEDGEVGLGDGDEKTHHKAHGQENSQFLGLGETFTDILPHRGHGHIGPKVEQTDAEDQEEGREAEDRQFPGSDIYPWGYSEEKNQQRHRKNGDEGFLQFVPKGLPQIPQYRSFFFHGTKIVIISCFLIKFA